jgi:hypothetical protein
MSSVGGEIRDNPHATKIARQALALTTLNIWFSKNFSSWHGLAGKERCIRGERFAE